MRDLRAWRRIFLVGVAFLAIAVGSHTHARPAAASPPTQSDQALRRGEPVHDTLDNSIFRRIYTFAGQGGESITLTMNAGEDSALDPYLLLTDERGTILAISDDSGETVNAHIASKRLPADGRYFVIATRFGQEHGSTTGTFTLLLNTVGSDSSSSTSANNTIITYGESAFGRITNEQPQLFYFLRATRGDVISIHMQRTSGNLDPHLDLATSQGQVLVSNDDSPEAQGTLDAAIQDYRVLTSDIYLIVATRFGREAGSTQGSFVITVSRTPLDDLGDSAETALLLDYGMTVQGELTDERPQRFYEFQAGRGDVVTLSMNNTNGNLDPYLRLLNANQEEIASDDNSGENRNARIAAYTIPITDRYIIVATRFGLEQGQSTGSYSFSLNGRPGVVGGQALEIIYGAAVSGQINQENVSEQYVFFGQAGDTIRVSMARSTGDLDPLVTLYDSDRKQIAFDDDSGTDQDALLESFELPRDDMYLISASRFDREAGTTSGAYELTLELIRAR